MNKAKNMQTIENKQGFSMIELLVALAVIGILSAAIVIGLQSSKIGAKDDAALLAANEAVDAVLDCMDREKNITNDNPICNGGKNRAELPGGWIYSSVDGNFSNKTYEIKIRFPETGAATKTITCSNTNFAGGKCITEGF